MAPRLGLGGGVTANPASGLFAAPTATPLLDTYANAHRAYSVRKLRTDYSGYAMKVRRADNNEADVAFDASGRVSGSSMIANPDSGGVSDLDTWVGSGGSDHCYVSLWYDQSGEGVNAVQADTDDQPKLYNAGSLITVGDPARAALRLDGSNDWFHVDEVGLVMGATTVFALFKNATTDNNQVPWGLSNNPGNYFLHLNYGGENQFWYDAGEIADHPIDTDQNLWAYKGGLGAQRMYKNGTASDETGTNTAANAHILSNMVGNGIGSYSGSAFHWAGEFQEFIAYDSDQTSNRTAIEADINTEFGLS